MIEIVTNNNFDFDNYEYAICECTSWDEGIQVPRKEDNYFASFNCPRCGRELGLFVRQRNIKIDDDTVSRKAALDAIMGEPTDAHYPSWYAERIKALPPSPTVQLDHDTVSKQAVIEDVCTMLQNCFDASDEMIESVKITVGELPPSPSRPKGQWIPCTKNGLPLSKMAYRDGQKWYGYKCSNCNFIYKGNALTESPYCQKCGADMRGIEHE